MRPTALILLLAAAACSRSSAAPTDAASQSLKGFTMTQTEKSEKVWRLKAPKARLTLDGDAAILHPEVWFYRDGKHTSTATAKRAQVKGEGARDVRLEEDVVIRALKEDVVLRTSRLDYVSAEKSFRTDEEVVVDRPGARMRGRGLKADASLTEITIYDQETTIR